MKGGFRGKLQLKGFLDTLPSWRLFFGFVFQRDWTGGQWKGLALMSEAPSKPPWEYLEPPLIQQRPFSWKGLGAQKGGCAFCDCQG